MSVRKTQLNKLIKALEHLCIHLRLDENCLWTQHFERQLRNAKNIANKDLTQNELNELSSSVRSVYGGMGSFNDYYNPSFSKQRNEIIKQIGSSIDLSKHVYEYALELEVIGHTIG